MLGNVQADGRAVQRPGRKRLAGLPLSWRGRRASFWASASVLAAWYAGTGMARDEVRTQRTVEGGQGSPAHDLRQGGVKRQPFGRRNPRGVRSSEQPHRPLGGNVRPWAEGARSTAAQNRGCDSIDVHRRRRRKAPAEGWTRPPQCRPDYAGTVPLCPGSAIARRAPDSGFSILSLSTRRRTDTLGPG